MPQYLVANYLPDDFDPSRRNRSDDRGDPRAQREMIAAAPGSSLAEFPASNAKDGAEAA